MSTFSRLTALMVIFMLVVGCKCCQTDLCDDPTDPNCPNYDPCSGFKKANFNAIWINTLGGKKPDYYPGLFNYRVPYPNQDTLTILPGSLTLICDEEHDEYYWQIGDHFEELTGQEVSLYFDSIYTGPITVRLITKDKPIYGCFTNDGLDTAYKTFVLEKGTPRPAHSLWVDEALFGSYVGSDLGVPNTERTVTIKNEVGDISYIYHRIYGVCPQCMPPGVIDSLHVSRHKFKNSILSFQYNGDNVFNLLLRGYLKGQDSLYITYLYPTKIGKSDSFGNWIPENGWEWEIREFRGKRVR